MRTPVVVLGVAVALWIVPSSSAAQEADVGRAVSETLAAWKAGDFEAFGQFYHPETRGFFLDGGVLLEGFKPETLQGAYDSGFRADLTLRDLEVELMGTAAVSSAYLDGTLTLPNGTEMPGTWRYTETRVEHEGTWKVIQYHFSRLTVQASR